MVDIKAILSKEKKYMIEYAKENQKTFFEESFNPVDSLILSQISYMNLAPCVPKKEENKPFIPISHLYKAEHFSKMLDNIPWNPQGNKELLFAVCASRRYRDVLVNYFENIIDLKSEKQFCAITFLLPTAECYVAFRGTDATIIGWKEDFNMMFKSYVPSQKSAQNYLEFIMEKIKMPIYLGGHSKGGNLAIFAGANINEDLQDRIKEIHAFDSPGFMPEIIKTDGMKRIEKKIINFCPNSSFVSLIFESIGRISIIKSERLGIFQHDSFSWEVEKSDFIYLEEFQNSATIMDKTLNSWIYSLTNEQRQTFVDAVYSIISVTGAKNLSEFSRLMITENENIRKTIKSLDEETANCVKLVIKNLASASFKSVFHNE